MTDSKILKDLKKKITRAKEDDQIIFMVKVGMKVPLYSDPTKSGDAEVWTDPVVIPESLHDEIVKMLKKHIKGE